ncbi:MAG TPA: hypothetical protein VJS69_05345 [Candidatus Krumholzibacteria bacterium]|nr:hypothetical protein [Candidatus Krumholzibacteria bacterium]
MKPVGFLLIVAGLFGITWGGITYIKNRDAPYFGPVHITTESHNYVLIPPMAGVTALVLGGLLVVLSTRGGMRVVS